MSLRISERAQRVGIAQSQLVVDILDFAREHDLTNIELLQALNGVEASILKYMLRSERHPEDPDQPADCE